MLIPIGVLAVNIVCASVGAALACSEPAVTVRLRGFLGVQGAVMWLSVALLGVIAKTGVVGAVSSPWVVAAMMGSALSFCLTLAVVWYTSRRTRRATG